MNLLSNLTFRSLFISRCISLLGTGLATIGLAFLAYHLSHRHAGLIIGTALTIKMLAYIITAPILGHLSQKISRKNWLISMDLLRVIFVLLIPFVNAIWQIYGLIFLISTCSAAFTPIYQALIPEILPNEQEYSQALVLARVAYNVETLASPAFSALLLLMFNYKILFFINASTFFISALLIMRLTLTKVISNDKTSVKLFSGIIRYLSNKTLIACLCLIMISSLAGATVIVNTVVFFHGLFHQSKSITALAMGAFGIGSIFFAIFIPKLKTKFNEKKVMLLGSIIIILTFFFSSEISVWYWLLFTWLILGIGSIAVEALLTVIINKFSNAKSRTAMFAANFSLTHGCWLLAYFFSGVMATHLSLAHYFLVISFATLILFIIANLIMKHNVNYNE